MPNLNRVYSLSTSYGWTIDARRNPERPRQWVARITCLGIEVHGPTLEHVRWAATVYALQYQAASIERAGYLNTRYLLPPQLGPGWQVAQEVKRAS